MPIPEDVNKLKTALTAKPIIPFNVESIMTRIFKACEDAKKQVGPLHKDAVESHQAAKNRVKMYEDLIKKMQGGVSNLTLRSLGGECNDHAQTVQDIENVLRGRVEEVRKAIAPYLGEKGNDPAWIGGIESTAALEIAPRHKTAFGQSVSEWRNAVAGVNAARSNLARIEEYGKRIKALNKIKLDLFDRFDDRQAVDLAWAKNREFLFVDVDKWRGKVGHAEVQFEERVKKHTTLIDNLVGLVGREPKRENFRKLLDLGPVVDAFLRKSSGDVKTLESEMQALSKQEKLSLSNRPANEPEPKSRAKAINEMFAKTKKELDALSSKINKFPDSSAMKKRREALDRGKKAKLV